MVKKGDKVRYKRDGKEYTYKNEMNMEEFGGSKKSGFAVIERPSEEKVDEKTRLPCVDIG